MTWSDLENANDLEIAYVFEEVDYDCLYPSRLYIVGEVCKKENAVFDGVGVVSVSGDEGEVANVNRGLTERANDDGVGASGGA